jgi:Bacterial extracellular solute-binding protein
VPRSVLAVLVGAVAFTASVQAQSSCVESNSQQLIVYHPGSLSAAFTPVEQAFTCQTGVQVQDVSVGSVDLARQVTVGAKPADIVASADYVDIDLFLKPASAASFDIVFPHGRMVLAYLASGLAVYFPIVLPAAAGGTAPAVVLYVLVQGALIAGRKARAAAAILLGRTVEAVRLAPFLSIRLSNAEARAAVRWPALVGIVGLAAYGAALICMADLIGSVWPMFAQEMFVLVGW